MLKALLVLLVCLSCAKRPVIVEKPVIHEALMDAQVKQFVFPDTLQTEQLEIELETTAPINLAAIVYFDFDKYELRPDAMGELNLLARELRKAVPSMLIEGHCDERGTVEYNMALGEHRAIAVRRYLNDCGVDTRYCTTTSFGKERPADAGHNEAAWAKNRRAEINVTNNK